MPERPLKEQAKEIKAEYSQQTPPPASPASLTPSITPTSSATAIPTASSSTPAKKSRKPEAFFALIVFVVVLATASYILLELQEEKYDFQAAQEGVLFLSNVEEPAVFLVKLRSQDSFLVSPAFSGTAASNTFATNALILFNTVLISKQKESISLLREIENNELAFCQTNEGDVKTDERLEAEQCIELMNDASKVLILIQLPDPTLEQTKVILEPQRIEILPKRNSDIPRASYLVLKTMYADSDETIQQINDFLAQIQAQ